MLVHYVSVLCLSQSRESDDISDAESDDINDDDPNDNPNDGDDDDDDEDLQIVVSVPTWMIALLAILVIQNSYIRSKKSELHL